ncbi:hypothetical protein LSH36_77g04016 [Paralvinella palmiformis]|uniref:ADP-ribosylation factor-like protein 6 n=1 Tax=Paralvinella palmiformis TaxID=53620 RepID=A0AAD9K438_9ANNE|nr:hypothetical protein LSH36_77g04016 [Paralvinella palmiformis]
MAWLNRFGWLIGPKNTEAKVVIIGLVNSGKSTIMQQLKPRDITMTKLTPNIPIGMTAERFVFKTLTFVAFDLEDIQNGFGNPWEDHYRDCHGVIFVVDSADRMNTPLVRIQLDKMLRNPLMEKRHEIPILILANKTDQPGAVPSLQLAQLLELSHLNRPWHIVCSDGLTGEGLNEAMDWLAHRLRAICCKYPHPTLQAINNYAH